MSVKFQLPWDGNIVGWQTLSEVSKQLIAVIFRGRDCLTLNFFTLQMKALGSFETPITKVDTE